VATNGAIAAHYEYSPFGEIVVQSGDLADAFTHRFSTKPCCAVTGLSEYEFRKYSPELGRWVNRDPIGERGGLNLYVLVGNRPGDEYDLLGLSWPGALAKCGLEALKKVLGDKLGQEIKGARLCEKVADHILANLMADPCQRQSFNLDKPPLTFDVNNWAQVALSCILGQVRSAGGIDKFLEKMDDKSKQKMLEKFMDLGEAKLSDFLKSNTPTISYSISYKCDSKESVGFDLTSHLMIKVDGKVEDLPLAAGDTSEQWRCDINPVAKWSNVFSDFCCGCKTLLDKPQKKE
jgi:RHS repeat-associated protein